MSLMFPIAEVCGHKLISIHGHISHFYRLHSPDLEQKTPDEREVFWEGVKSSLDALDERAYFKFYRLGGKSYLETNGECPHFSEVKLILANGPLNIFFGKEGLFSAVGIYDDYLAFNGHYFRILSASEFGEGEMSHGIPRDVDYLLSLKKLPKDKATNRLERIRNSHFSSFFKDKRDVSSEGAYGQAEDLLQEIVQGHETLFEMELFFIVSGLSLEALDAQTRVLQQELLTQKIKVCVEGQSLIKLKSGLAQFFTEIIPGVKPQLGLRKHLDKSGHIECLLPLGQSHLMDKGIEFSDQGDQKLFFDPFAKNIKNRNMLITGASGTGKSVLANKIIHHLACDHSTVILDKGGSFKRLTMFHQGKVLNGGFNPMQFKCPLYLREIILSLADAESFSKLERGKLLREIKSALKSGVEQFSDLVEYLQKEFPQIGLYFEEVGDFFTDEVIENSPILYVDLENYPKAFVAPLIIFILQYFKSIPEAEKILVFDECWSFLKSHASYIDECFRTFRKTGAFPIAISQSLKDFAATKETYQAIANNCYFHAIFPQELSESDGELSSFDRENIRTLACEKDSFAECYFKTPDNKFRKTLRIHLSPLELELFKTDYGSEKQLLRFIDQTREFFNTVPESINAFVRLKYGHHQEDHSLLDMFSSTPR